MRKHPILGYNKCIGEQTLHSWWTIMASGAGKIIRARWCGGGGNCKNKHNSTYQTVYAHMKILLEE